VSRNNSNVPEPGKTAAPGAREDTRISQRKLAQELPTALTHAPRSLIKEGENCSITDGTRRSEC
jgi:hypothetical protein